MVADDDDEMTWSQYVIRSRWGPDGLTPVTIGEHVTELLHSLAPVSPAMANWQLFNQPEDVVDYGDVATRMGAFVEDNVARDDWEEPDPDAGYEVLIAGAEAAESFGAQDSVNINVVAGAKHFNKLEFYIGAPFVQGFPSEVTYPVYRGALEALVSAWPCPWALASRSSPYEPRAGGHPARPSLFDLAWIAFLSAPLAKGLTLPDGLTAESTPGGGLILGTVRTLLDQGNPDHVRLSGLLEAVMLDRVGGESSARQLPHPARVGPY